ncbi:VOC family protein [Lentibacillus sediminis]|uniref:VOC family protein n=1 Tax=Lentibacillus sediminis TaxID=1940529 RepID=UPI001EFE2BE1|nr:VOC family protein [Lentibacillus sediminis]
MERIDTICLKVADIEQSSRWYQNVLGFKEAFRGEDHCILNIGDSAVPLTIEKDKEQAGEPRQSQVYPIFYTKDIEKTCRQLQKQEVKTGEIQYDGVNKFVDFFDLDGNRLQACFWE